MVTLMAEKNIQNTMKKNKIIKYNFPINIYVELAAILGHAGDQS
jgi:hypothetical protein